MGLLGNLYCKLKMGELASRELPTLSVMEPTDLQELLRSQIHAPNQEGSLRDLLLSTCADFRH
jgi:hypothetical protein